MTATPTLLAADVSVVSVDDIALAAYASPALTTVRQPFEEMGRAAAQRLISHIEGTDAGDEPACIRSSSSAHPPRLRRPPRADRAGWARMAASPPMTRPFGTTRAR
ncbi:substrate-binding domain-containing protein [Microbacterium sp. AR7-10]|uniref:substrate-binding domain-containing protein n=1 Tax=Microbacterium sp. AR7-10 TaxID=1891970 RepID=UPI00091F7DF2|nr:hypothetical protein BFN01_09120 [Microbacterium sp. AR7-10]